MPETPIEMTSRRPYLLRALYEWILDNSCSPFLLVDARVPGTVVPQQHIKDHKIVLNLSPSAVRGLEISDEAILFSARFSGAAMQLTVPVDAVLALYASENGEGMVFGVPSHVNAEPADLADAPKPITPTTGPVLGLVKDSAAEPAAGSGQTSDNSSGPDDDGPDGGGPSSGKPDAKRRPALRVVK